VPLGTLASSNLPSGFALPATASASQAAYVLKYSAAGALLGYATVDGTGADAAYDVATDTSGNAYVTGTYVSSGIVGLTNLATSNQAIVTALPAAASGAAFVLKYDPNGNLLGYSTVDGTAADTGYAVACDAANNAYAVGSYVSSAAVPVNVLALGTLASAFTLPPTVSTTAAVYVLKFDPFGNVLGASAAVDGTGADAAYDVSPDPSAGNVYVSGSYASTGAVTVKNLDGTGSLTTLPIATYAPFLAQYTPARVQVLTVTTAGTLALAKTAAQATAGLALDVSGAAAVSTSVAVGKPAATAATLDVAGTASVTGTAYVGALGVGVANPGAAALVVNGAVGVGTTAPAAMLHVVGNVYATGDVNAFYTASDARLKDDLAPISGADARHVLDGLTPYRFRWNEDAAREALKVAGAPDVGMLAQDVAAVCPEATRVSRSDFGARAEHLSMDYTKLIPFLVAAVREQGREIEALRKQVGL